MYSYEDRLRAVALYIKYDRSLTSVVRELGYPSQTMLLRWYKEYREFGELHKQYARSNIYTLEQKQAAVGYYLEHGRSLNRAIRVVGYPTREVLTWWIDELAPGERKVRIKRGTMIQFSHEQKKNAVVELCVRDGSASAVADIFGTSRCTLYKWKKELLGQEGTESMGKPKSPYLSKKKDDLVAEIESLKKQVYKLQIERDILEKAAEIIKKDPGIDPKSLVNKEKTALIDALRKIYSLNELLVMIDLSKSSYFYQREAQRNPDKYSDLRTEIKKIFYSQKRRYGYRRIHSELNSRVSEKVIRRIMLEEQLVAKGRKKRRYSSYTGEITPAADNIIGRDFHSDAPNVKWLTDITEFHIPAGKVYLSPIIDCFDGMAVSWAISTNPNAELVNTMLDDAINILGEEERPIVHSDRGAHYRWPGWIDRIDKAGLTRSMSKKGCSPDNSACEGFFGRLKNEMFYEEKWLDTTIEKFMDEINDYVVWYNEKRIKMSLGGKSPVEFRRSIGLTA